MRTDHFANLAPSNGLALTSQRADTYEKNTTSRVSVGENTTSRLSSLVALTTHSSERCEFHNKKSAYNIQSNARNHLTDNAPKRAAWQTVGAMGDRYH